MSYEYSTPVSQEERDRYAYELSERAMESDPDCIQDIYRTFYGPVVGHLRRKTDPQLAEDLAQETFISASKAIEEGRFTQSGNKALINWLMRIATNKAIDTHKKSQRRGDTVPVDFQELPDYYVPASADFAPYVDDAYASDDFVVRVTDGMNPDQLSAVVAIDIEGRSYLELAEQQRVSIGTVKSRLHRGRGALRNALLEQQDTPE